MDMILVNANVITMDPAARRESALAVKWDRIFKVGADHEIRGLAGAGTRIIDLRGKTILPGFIDTHNHLSFYGYLVSSVDCRQASGVSCIADIIDRLRSEADRTPAGQWVKGWGYAHYYLKENRPLTRTDLDEVSDKHPILLIQVSGHAGVANTPALDLFGYTKDTPDPPGGAIRHDPRTGEPNGILEESALMNQVNGLFLRDFLTWSLEQRVGIIETAVNHYNQAGITALHEAYVIPQSLQLYQEMERLGRLNLRIYTMNIDFAAQTLLDAGIACGYGTPMVKVGPIKMFMDGGMSNRTAAVSQPYENSAETGIYLSAREDMFSKVEKFHNAGYQIAVHAQGDAAIGILLDAFENVLGRRSPNPLRHRIEHCGNITEEQIRRAAEMNILVSSQPMFLSHLGDGFLEAFGPERGHRLYPYRSLINHGIRLAGASDSPVAPASPLTGIRDAILRLTGSGKEIGPEERLSATEAVGLYTSEAAHFSFDENNVGTIEPGKYADLVVLDHDITGIPPEQITEAKIEMTIVGGKVVYEHA
ncbi:amidohydrolase [Candidatus Poribacteria bacterium]|nr:amidohydrolase [Candidatus Poribacteria bacterium]